MTTLQPCLATSDVSYDAEEFGIYLNYVRKLGFEETPDYDFLRELFAKVMKNNNDVDDGVYDWNTLFQQASVIFACYLLCALCLLRARYIYGSCSYPPRVWRGCISTGR
jgi:hypothetical protein